MYQIIFFWTVTKISDLPVISINLSQYNSGSAMPWSVLKPIIYIWHRKKVLHSLWYFRSCLRSFAVNSLCRSFKLDEKAKCTIRDTFRPCDVTCGTSPFKKRKTIYCKIKTILFVINFRGNKNISAMDKKISKIWRFWVKQISIIKLIL